LVWDLNSGPHACQAGGVALEPLFQSKYRFLKKKKKQKQKKIQVLKSETINGAWYLFCNFLENNFDPVWVVSYSDICPTRKNLYLH
jgi:hypothetical protein